MKLEERPEAAPGSVGGTLRFLAFALLAMLIVLAVVLVTGLAEFPVLRDAAWRAAAVVGILAVGAVLVALLMRRRSG
jgi:hypothetical protein